MNESNWDDALAWPFSGRISLSILDQNNDGEYKARINESFATQSHMRAFQRPKTPLNEVGNGYPEFADLEDFQEEKYVKNDCLLVQVQVYLSE